MLKGIHWCSWRELCAPRPVGGLGFRVDAFERNQIVC